LTFIMSYRWSGVQTRLVIHRTVNWLKSRLTSLGLLQRDDVFAKVMSTLFRATLKSAMAGKFLQMK